MVIGEGCAEAPFPNLVTCLWPVATHFFGSSCPNSPKKNPKAPRRLLRIKVRHLSVMRYLEPSTISVLALMRPMHPLL